MGKGVEHMMCMGIHCKGSSLSILNKGKYKRFSGSLITHLRLQFYFFSIFKKLVRIKFMQFLIFFGIGPSSTLIFVLIFSLFISFVLLPLCCCSLNSIVHVIAYLFYIFLLVILFFCPFALMLLLLVSIFLLFIAFCFLS